MSQHLLISDRMAASDWVACGACILGTIGIGLTTVERSGRDEVVILVGVLLILFFVLTGLILFHAPCHLSACWSALCVQMGMV